MTTQVPHPSLDSSLVAAVRAGKSAYKIDQEMDDALSTLSQALGWSVDGGVPFQEIIPRGSRVLVKPNWVLHRNQGKGGFDCLITHGSVVKAVLRALGRLDISRYTLGDAPVQGCDFGTMLRSSGLDHHLSELSREDNRFVGPLDFRRTISHVDSGVVDAKRNIRSEGEYVLFDLGAASYLEPVTDGEAKFRVTMYPPELMAQTHAPGRHRYLVAREVLEADVLLNLPKLKTHKKAGITCALKNLVGINGNKEYLPHHRFGGSDDGGDCYPGSSPVKRLLEQVLDVQNSSDRPQTQRLMATAARALQAVTSRMGDEYGVEGSWSGNDTVWRMCLDLNRIALYGRPDGTIAPTPQRRLLHVADAIVGGQGDGPLSPDPLELGLLLGSGSAVALDWVGAHLMRYDARRIPIAYNAFSVAEWPLSRFTAESVTITFDNEPPQRLAEATLPTVPVTHPVGWVDAAAT